MACGNSELESGGNAKVPASGPELGTRISAVIDLYPLKRNAAEMAGVSTDQLARYAKGTSAPPFEVLARLALGKGVSLNWLATGNGEMLAQLSGPADAAGSQVNEDLLEACIAGVEAHLAERRQTLPPGKKATLIALLYQEMLERERESTHTGKPGGEGLGDLIGRFVRLAS